MEGRIPIRSLIKEQERRLRRVVKASQIFPELLTGGEPIVERYLMLRELEELGVKEIALSIRDCEKADHPYPPEVLTALGAVHRRRGSGAVYRGGNEAYIALFHTSYERGYYAVVPCREWFDPLGDPDTTYRGLKAYSVERVSEYVEWCLGYVWNWLRPIYGEEACSSMCKDIKRSMEEVMDGASAFILTTARSSYWKNDYLVVLDPDLKKRGVEVLKGPSLLGFSSWVVERGEARLLAIPDDEKMRELAEEYRREAEEEERRQNMVKKLLKPIMEGGKVCDMVWRASLSQLDEVLRIKLGERGEKLAQLIRRLCVEDEVYLVDTHPWWRTPYGRGGISAYYPLKTLYALREFRESGISAQIFVKRRGDLPKTMPSTLLKVEEIYFGGGLGSKMILVKPKGDLEVKYPFEAKWDGDSIVIVDRGALEKVLAGGER